VCSFVYGPLLSHTDVNAAVPFHFVVVFGVRIIPDFLGNFFNVP
jgi:hypothetical protein